MAKSVDYGHKLLATEEMVEGQTKNNMFWWSNSSHLEQDVLANGAYPTLQSNVADLHLAVVGFHHVISLV